MLPWQQLLAADALLQTGPLTDAFVLYRTALERLPSMISIHDSVARIYEQTGHADWAARERAAGTLPAADCVRRKALCDFRAGRYHPALTAVMAAPDAESRYWRARAANELALAAFKHLDELADSAERRAVRATQARAQERYVDAVAELKAALTFAPGDPALTSELASSYYSARDFEQALATLSPLLRAHPDDVPLLKMVGYSLLQLRRLDEALPLLQRVVERDPADPAPRLALGRAYVQNGDFAAAIPLIEAQLADDWDGSLHVQLARAYTGLGQRDKAAALLARSQEIQRADQERSAAAAQRTLTPPK
jgi:predicted Zn-dependent protease